MKQNNIPKSLLQQQSHAGAALTTLALTIGFCLLCAVGCSESLENPDCSSALADPELCGDEGNLVNDPELCGITLFCVDIDRGVYEEAVANGNAVDLVVLWDAQDLSVIAETMIGYREAVPAPPADQSQLIEMSFPLSEVLVPGDALLDCSRTDCDASVDVCDCESGETALGTAEVVVVQGLADMQETVGDNELLSDDFLRTNFARGVISYAPNGATVDSYPDVLGQDILEGFAIMEDPPEGAEPSSECSSDAEQLCLSEVGTVYALDPAE